MPLAPTAPLQLSDAEISALADFPGSFWKRFTVTPDDLDGFNHVNNAVYLKWIDAMVWEHTRHAGLSEEFCMALNRGMAAVKHEIHYLSSARLGDEVVVYNWISSNDGRLRCSRSFQMIRLNDRKTILRAQSDYVSTNLTTGRPTRMPEEFKTGYAVTLPMDQG